MPGPRVYSTVTGDVMGLAAAAEVEREAPECRLRRLFDTHHRRLYVLARRMVRTSDEARDLVQETFLRIARAPASVPAGASSEEAWLVRVMVNLCRDEWRKRAARTRLDDRYHADARVLPPSSQETAFVAHTTIWQALQRLTPRRRAALILYELEGSSVPEIARALGVSHVTVRWHLSRGRRELAHIIAGTGKANHD